MLALAGGPQQPHRRQKYLDVPLGDVENRRG